MIKVSEKTIQDTDRAMGHEWLVANGAGGYASSSIIGANTRQYHGLLVASFVPPLERQIVLSKVDEELVLGDQSFSIGTNEFKDGTIFPTGYQLQQSFYLVLGIPTFEYRSGGVRILKQVWMERGKNTVFVKYSLLDAESPVTLRIRPYCAFRGYHGDGRHGGERHFSVCREAYGAVVIGSSLEPYRLRMSVAGANFDNAPDWYWNFMLRAERDRGFNCLEDLYTPGCFYVVLSPGETVGLAASVEEDVCFDEKIDAAYEREVARRQKVVVGEQDAFRKDLFLAADQFVVKTPSGRSCIMAGYHWFTDWGRDSMISLPGILLETRRFPEARSVLLEYGSRVKDGLIPNRFTDTGEAEYNTADASLCFFEALNRYMVKSQDHQILSQVFPKLEEIIYHHTVGTKYGIAVDDTDGLLRSGTVGSQLTWMDARVDGVPVTPRIGKAVEINALWYNALMLMSQWSEELGLPSSEYSSAAEKCYEGFNKRFWNKKGQCLFDVVDGPAGDDATLRPNQIVAVSLPFSPLEKRRWKSVVDIVEKHLLTPYGLRTLSPEDPRYRGAYAGPPAYRDASYHQGTVWPWLLGPFVDAHLRVYKDPKRIEAMLKDLRKHLKKAGLGSISEVFSADKPHDPGGCISQAWSVGEILRITDLVLPKKA